MFSFLIGREATERKQIEWMACVNKGRKFIIFWYVYSTRKQYTGGVLLMIDVYI